MQVTFQQPHLQPLLLPAPAHSEGNLSHQQQGKDTSCHPGTWIVPLGNAGCWDLEYSMHLAAEISQPQAALLADRAAQRLFFVWCPDLGLSISFASSDEFHPRPQIP